MASATTDAPQLDELANRLENSTPPQELHALSEAVAAFETSVQDDATRRACTSITHRLVDLRLTAPVVTATILARLRRLNLISADAMSHAYDREVTALVEGMIRLDELQWGSLGGESSENLRRMFMAMAADIRVVLMMLATQVEKMRRLRSLPEEERDSLAMETMDVFAPLANRLGVFQLKWELEDLALRQLEPKIYADISTHLAQRRGERNAFVQEAMDALSDALTPHGIHAEISGRPKHIYSIYKKMQRKRLPFEQIYDVLAVRVLVEEISECYAVLGVVHGMYTPIAGEFDDYVARPKENMYQSLHTAVVGPTGRPLEIQIRTRDMHQFAEYGVAAHWAYKEGRKTHTADREFNLLRQLMDWQKQVTDPSQLAESLRNDIFQDRVYVFTPAGDVLDFPSGATTLDFAYRVHTLVGHRCRGARMNGHMVTLDTELVTGARVEILTKKHPEPSRDWLNPHLGYLKTSTARHKVRHWFREQGRDEAISQGREQVARELAKAGVERPDLDAVASSFGYDHSDELHAAVGHGDLGAHTIAVKVLEALTPPQPADPPSMEASAAKPVAGGAGGVRLDGVSDILSQAARCCGPVPGDDVIGFISRGRGIVIHRRNCSNMVNCHEPERVVEIDWGGDRKHRYPVSLEVETIDRPGAFRDVANVISNLGVNMRSARSQSDQSGQVATINVTIDATTAEDVVRLLGRLERLPVVIAVRRLRDS
jgi:RelA/SpoT family (p)ppGpp synthetase